jgi:hypothetical protein
MLKHLRANAVAYLALLFALGGTSYAASSALMPPNSVGSKQVINHSLKRVDFKAGQLPRGPRGPRGLRGLQGPPGLQGAQGAKGDAGAAGAAGATNVTVRTFEAVVGPLENASEFVACPSGQRATGGGGGSDPTMVVYETHPANAAGVHPVPGEIPVGWRVGVKNTVSSPQTFTIFVVCAAP